MSDLIPHNHRWPPTPERGKEDGAADTVEPREVLRLLRRRIWLLVVCVVLGAGLGYGVAQIREPRYRAHAVIRVADPRNQMVEGLGGLVAASGSNVDPMLSALEVLSSQGVLGAIVDAEGLRLRSLDPEFRITELTDLQIGSEAPNDTINLAFTPDGVEASDSESGGVRARYGEELVLSGVRMVIPRHPGVEDARLEIQERQRAILDVGERLRARPREATDVVDVEFVSTDPELSQRVVNRAVSVFQTRSAEDARDESIRRRSFLEEQLTQADSSLNVSQQALSDFRSREQVFSSREWLAAQQVGLLDIDMRRAEMIADRQMYEDILDGLRESAGSGGSERLEAVIASPEVAQNPVVASLFAQLIQYETARDSLLSGPWGASAANPDVEWVNQQIEGTRGRLERAIRSHMDAVDARITALADLRDGHADAIGDLPQTEAEESRLVQQMESIRRTVEELTSEYYRAQVAEAVEEGPVQIVDFAPLPLDSEGIPVPVLIALGIMLGLVVGSGGALVLETLNNRIRHEDDLRTSLDLSSVGVIPKIAQNSRLVLLTAGNGIPALLGPAPKLDPYTNGSGHSGAGDRNGGVKVDSGLVMVADRTSPAAEAYRALRTNLLFAKGRGGLKTLVVTSALPSEGKTTTAANLAVAYAQQGLKVLVADCDLRKPRLAQMFGLPGAPGMADLALGNDEVTKVIRKFPAVEGLYVMPGGYYPHIPTEFLGSARIQAYLAILRETFDLIVLDTPPLSAGADAAVLGAEVDGVLMVVEAGQTDRDAATFAVRQLNAVGATLIGAVLNDPRGDVSRFGYYQEYGHYGDRTEQPVS